MVTDYEEIVALCDEELRHREYKVEYYERISNFWRKIGYWMENNKHTEFNEDIGNQYLVENFGTYLLPKNSHVSVREHFRAVRMLISYQKYGDFEFRSPSVEYKFSGLLGELSLEYLEYCRTELCLAEKTIENKRFYFCNFCKYMNSNEYDIDDLSVERTENFFHSQNYSLASRHNAARNIKLILKYAYDKGLSKKDCSIYVLPDNYKKNCKLPTTYEESEIQALIKSVERGSAIGKRDYLILLLAAEYGWRAKDITLFSFDDIDWDNNTIRFSQHKTDVPVEFPLLSSVGNAIIDYLKFARPDSTAPEIIVSMENANKGKPLSSPTIHSIVTKYMKIAGIKNWQNKKHGPHAMRHSLATNLLKRNIPMPIISTVMGHQNTDTTSGYISVDYDKLRRCVLPMPKIHSPYYLEEDFNG